MGILFVYRLRDGKDMAEPVNRVFETVKGWFTGNRHAPKKKRRQPQMSFKGSPGKATGQRASDSGDPSFQEKLDAILDKIKQQGYDSLSAEEKEFLFNASKK
jgi:hypothetical protein